MIFRTIKQTLYKPYIKHFSSSLHQCKNCVECDLQIIEILSDIGFGVLIGGISSLKYFKSKHNPLLVAICGSFAPTITICYLIIT